jgi:hypothetical protein
VNKTCLGNEELFAEDIPESGDGILRVFDELDLGLIAYVLVKGSVKIGHPRRRLIYHFLAMERDGTRYLALSILICDAFCEPFLGSKISGKEEKKKSRVHTFVKTAIDA